MEKLLTISVAAYNVEKYLEKCLESLVISSIDKIEVLIENDGSKDATGEIAQRYEEKYPGVFVHVEKKNGGYGSTINNSISLAKGKYFKQLDGDDWFDNANFEKFVQLLELIDVECIYTPYIEVYEPDMKQKMMKVDSVQAGICDLERIIADEKFRQMHALAYKTKLLKDNNIKILEHCFYTDQEYIVYPLIHTQKVYVFDIPLYCYRLGREGQSISLEGYRKHFEDHIRVAKQLLNHMKEIQMCTIGIANVLSQHVFRVINQQDEMLLCLGDKKEELREFNRYFKKNFFDIYLHYQKQAGKKIRLLQFTNFIGYHFIAKLKK